MPIYRGLDRFPLTRRRASSPRGPSTGIHRGHQAVIGTAVLRARALAVPAVVLTFDPHPMTVLRPRDVPPALLSLDERLDRIAELGPDVTLIIPFTEEFSRVDAETFVRDILLGLLRAREVVVGFNHTFGRGARGTPELLERVVAPAGVRVHVVPPLSVDGVAVSSSTIREALRRGDVRSAARLLGRPYAVRGIVARGDARGRTLGFPTANVRAPSDLLVADGVYAAHATWAGGTAPAVVNVGIRPTFDGGARLIEAHLLDVGPDLDEQVLTVAFLTRIREERRFGSIEALRQRIEEDVHEARRFFRESP